MTTVVVDDGNITPIRYIEDIIYQENNFTACLSGTIKRHPTDFISAFTKDKRITGCNLKVVLGFYGTFDIELYYDDLDKIIPVFNSYVERYQVSDVSLRYIKNEDHKQVIKSSENGAVIANGNLTYNYYSSVQLANDKNLDDIDYELRKLGFYKEGENKNKFYKVVYNTVYFQYCNKSDFLPIKMRYPHIRCYKVYSFPYDKPKPLTFAY